MRNYQHLATAAVLLLLSTVLDIVQLSAMELGEITVESHMGEPFSARVPFSLDEGASISNLSVELADVSDYNTLSVHYHSNLRLIRADIEKDFFNYWIEISSRSPISTPVFSILLKVRYGRATHFKKYPVFLDTRNGVKPSKQAPSMPSISFNEMDKASTRPSTLPANTTKISLVEPLLTEVETEKATSTTFTQNQFKPFDGWARTAQYGPLILGDTIFTIANRLRIDERYTNRQVMVALYEKNISKFAEDNLNLPIAGTYLDTPMAEEVEAKSHEEALSIIQNHNRRWEELTKQPRYAAIAEAQKNRYEVK